MTENHLRHLPSVDRVITDKRIQELQAIYSRSLLVDLVRRHLECERLSIMAGKPGHKFDEVVESIVSQAESLLNPSLRFVINATGVILHTNLGRAPLSKESVDAMEKIAGGFSNLEFDLENGKRGSRYVHIEKILCELTGAEAAMVVNNNAAGVLLALTTFAKRKEVIVSRGQAVEIGGGFRIPDVLRQSGARLVEVGTTNCTYAGDYEQAINERTAVLLRVHPSNFKIEGFTHYVSLEEMIDLGSKCNIPVFDDLGSGCFMDTTGFCLDPEPIVQDSISKGAGLAFFSGDKLVGGPQAGIVVGKMELINKMRKNALARAVRIDKIRLAGLATTLVHYLKGEAVNKIPVWRMVAMPLDIVEERAGRWAKAVGRIAEVVGGESTLGGGSLPGSSIPTRLVSISGRYGNRNRSVAYDFSQMLRRNTPPLIGRISGDILFLDPRTVLPEEDDLVIEALTKLSANVE